MAIKKLKLNLHATMDNLLVAQVKLMKYDGSGTMTSTANWTAVGTAWSPSTGGDLDINTRIYHAPSDWTLDKGDIWALVIYQWVSSGTNDIKFTGGIVIEEDWNDQVSS